MEVWNSFPVSNQTGNEIHFATVSLTTLVDSPVITASSSRWCHWRRIRKSNGHRGRQRRRLGCAAGSWDHYKNLVEQASKLFGAHHYSDYHFLLSLSDHVAHFGLEHHESDDSRIGERGLVDDGHANWRQDCCPMSTCIRGTGSTGAQRAWLRRTTRCPCRTICFGCTRADQTILASCSPAVVDYVGPTRSETTGTYRRRP